MQPNVFIAYSANDDKKSVNKQTFDKIISKAEDYMIIGRWNKAIDKFREAISFYQEGYNPDINLIRIQIRLCSEEILYIKNIEKGQIAYEKKSYKKAIDYFESALAFKKDKKIEKVLIKSKKKIIRNQINDNFIKPNSESTPSKKINFKINFKINYKILSLILFLIVLILSIIILSKYFPYEISIKRKENSYKTYQTKIPIQKIEKTTSKNIIPKHNYKNNNKVVPKQKSNYTVADINQKYLDRKIIVANNLISKKKYNKAIDILTKIDTKTFIPAQKEELNSKINYTVNLKITNIRNSVNYYTKKNRFNKKTHNYLYSQINTTIKKPFISRNKKNELIKLFPNINDIYVLHYLKYANSLVKEHKYKKAKENLRFLQHKIIYTTKKQNSQILNKISDIEKIERMVNNF